jgi:Family of unknown function (DUF5329)
MPNMKAIPELRGLSPPPPNAHPAAMRSLLIILLTLTLAPSLRAEPVSPAVRTEIDALLVRLQSSGCTFNRNGAWHGAAEARSHLLRKLEYLERRNAVHSTEQFIDLGASGSSVSGRPYLVKCGNAAPIESRMWLTTELRSIRAAAGVRPAPVQ